MKRLPNILILDDDVDVLVVCRDHLADQNVHMSANVRHAMEVLESEHIDLVVTDVMLTESSGYDVLREIKEKFPRMPVILMSGFASIEMSFNAVRYGAISYLEKPFRRGDLRREVKFALRGGNNGW